MCLLPLLCRLVCRPGGRSHKATYRTPLEPILVPACFVWWHLVVLTARRTCIEVRLPGTVADLSTVR